LTKWETEERRRGDYRKKRLKPRADGFTTGAPFKQGKRNMKKRARPAKSGPKKAEGGKVSH